MIKNNLNITFMGRCMKVLSLLIVFSLSGFVDNQPSDHQFIFAKKIKVSHSEIDAQYIRFTPTLREIQQADSISKIYIKNNRNKYPWADEIPDYATYYRQYVGYLNLNNQKTIFINSFCKPQPDWKNSLIQVRGGGSCYFNLKVDLQSHKAFNLNVNAPR